MSATLELSKQLIAQESITPNDAECQQILAARLQAMGFEIQHLPFGDTHNLWARRGTAKPLFVFAGHTDVVPTGPLKEWTSPPFVPTIRDGFLYGRGAADMKGSLAAMVTACEAFIAEHASYNGSIALLITSDEEGKATYGTRKVVEWLQQQGEQIDMCLVGEPSSHENVGDVIKNGRRGSLSGELTIHGKQGHIAYPHLADNPIHKALKALDELCSTLWDTGNDSFPATSFQIANVNAGTGATNIIPGELQLQFNFRYSTAVTSDVLKHRVITILDKHNLNYAIDWHCSGQPFLTNNGALLQAVRDAIADVTGLQTQVLTTGGTSDGRFIAPTGAQVVELGPVNRTIHQIDECVRIEDLDILSELYQRILQLTLVSS